MRLAGAIHWYSQGMISQGKAAEIVGLSRTAFLDELFWRKVPALQITIEELRAERLSPTDAPDFQQTPLDL